ncbi:MAG: TonB-dependent receptor, partial [Myxococcales bacterium]|nr:TonB-dependent receptor [Myxococcales bacterium]
SGLPLDANNNPILGVQTVRPEDVNNYELGIKTQFWDRRITLNLAGFWTDIYDYQATVNNYQLAVLRGYLANAGQVRTRGIELDSAFRPSTGLNLYVNAAYTDAKYIRFTNAPCPPELSGGSNSPPFCDISGQRLPGVSKWAFSYGAEYNWPVGAGQVYVGYDGSYRSDFSSNPSPSAYMNVDGYSLSNFRLGYRKGDKLNVFAWVRNAFDRNYYELLATQSDSTGQFADRVQTCQALIDWADVDEQAFNCDLRQLTAASSAGIEDNVYSLMPRPYRRKNAPYDSLEELHMVRGVNEDFWATFVDPEPTNPKKRVVTVWGQGAINVNTANAQTLHAVVCSGALPTTPICIDPNQAALFLTGVTMARGITMGAPLFGSPKDFVAALSGQGQLGPLLAGMGMQPVQFQSPAEFQKQITTESKVFSIYAVGIKKGYRRETRVKLHAVVDFRNAPELGQAMNMAGMPGMQGAGMTGAMNPLGGATGATTVPGAASGAIAAANMPSTGGQMLYFRIE